MSWLKVLYKTLTGLAIGASATVVANPEAVTTIAGAKHAAEITAIVALMSGFLNWLKNHKK